jgi:hypothetical protein
MKSKTRRFIMAVAVIGVLAAGGAAFTASNGTPGTTAGYSSLAVSGATVTKVTNNLNANGATIDSVDLTFQDSQQNNTVMAGFGIASDPNPATTITCVVSLTTPFKTAHCDGGGGAPLGVDTASAAYFDVAVTNNS